MNATATVVAATYPSVAVSTAATIPVDSELQAINVFRIFVTTIGILGNLFVILMILLLTEFKKGITAWYILQLAIADTAFLITLPFQVVEDQNHQWIFPDWLCKAKQTILFVNYYSSISFLTIMAVDRYIAICHSFSERLQKLRTHKAAYIITGIVWAVSILICIPIMLYSQVQGMKPYCTCTLEFPPPKLTKIDMCENEGMGDNEFIVQGNMTMLGMCLEILQVEDDAAYCQDPPKKPSSPPNITDSDSDDILNVGCHYIAYAQGFVGFLYFNFIVMFIVPFLIIAACYGLIIRHLITHSFRGDKSSTRPKTATKDDRNRNKVVIMCATLVVVFTICWLPYHAHHMAKMNGISGSSDYCRHLLYATSLLVYLNSAINPFIYFIVARLKSQFKRIKGTRAASAVLSLFTRQTNTDTTGSSGRVSGDNSSRTKATKTEDDNKVREVDTGL